MAVVSASAPAEEAPKEPKEPVAGETRKWEPVCKATDDDLAKLGTGIRTLSAFGDLVIAGSATPVLKVWQIGESKLTVSRKLKDGAVGASCVEVSPENMLAACYDDGCLGVWDLRQSTRAFVLESTSASSVQVRFLPTGYQLVTGGTSGSLCIWDLRARRLEMEIAPDSAPGQKKDGEDEPPKKKLKGEADKKGKPPSPIHSLAVSPDGNLVACGRGTGELSVMRLETREWVGDVTAHRAEIAPPVRGLCFDQTSRLLVSGGDDCQMCILGVADWARRGLPTETRWPQMERFSSHRGWISSVSMVSQRAAVTTSWDGTVRLFDLAAKKNLRIYKEHSDAVLASATSGRCFVTAGTDAVLALYKVSEAS